MAFKSKYDAKKPDEAGHVAYSAEDDNTWQTLYERQIKLMSGHACEEHIQGLNTLNLGQDKVPQVVAVNKTLKAASGWTVYPVEALISHTKFFQLLANRQFPAATFIRSTEEIDYVTEPDIFHEFFGHCPMLTLPLFGDFVSGFAARVLESPEEDWPLLQRLFWFTVEFGLIQTTEGLRAYGGGILSSPEEVVYSVKSDVPERRPFDALDIIRTPYRIDMLQPIYFVIESYDQLFEVMDQDASALIAEARRLGEHEPRFRVDDLEKGTIHIGVC